MNLLPILFALILIIGMKLTLLMSSLSSLNYQDQNLLGEQRARWNLFSLVEQKKYVKVKIPRTKPPKKEAPSLNPQEPKEPPKKIVPIAATRDTLHCHPFSKFNLSPLLNSSGQPHFQFLYETAARLLRLLYSSSPFYTERFEYELLDLMIAENKGEKQRGLLEILKAHLKDERVYKVCKGTQNYVPTKIGYPPLTDFFTINDESFGTPLFYYPHASLPLLNAFFGEKLAETLYRQEKQTESKWSPLTKKEVERSLAHYPELLHSLQKSVSFSKRKASRITVIDDKTKIRKISEICFD